MKSPNLRGFCNRLKLFGKFFSRPGDVIWFLRSLKKWQRSASEEWRASWSEVKPMLKDRSDTAGSARGHYFLQDIWAAQRVMAFRPDEHVDVGSRVDGFVAHTVSFCPKVTYVDIRPIATGVANLFGVEGTVCDLPYKDGSVRSLSCLHVIEHIGLGRYGDPMDPDGWLKGLSELQRALAPGGQLLLGTPCGRSRVVFHAHRVFDPVQIIDAMPDLGLEEFAYIRDGNATEWVDAAKPEDVNGLDYACGLFRFSKPESAS
ncbi:MAG: Uncharacterised protein [Gammaproteobacteria bacterium]|nr:MAG: Uncharacterised protein [Gammaproteobacteria bacterium]